jgi:tRNA-2-methylthio-N6-dimethylallyladenosine synthase
MPTSKNSQNNGVRKKRLCVITYGCQMNKYDSERMVGALGDHNFTLTEDAHSADVVLLNTCSIRAKAEQKFFSRLGRLKKYKVQNPNMIIGVGGCTGQIDSKAILNRAPYVDLVFGTLNIHRLPYLLEKISAEGGPVSEIFSDAGNNLEDYPVSRENNIQAWVSIMHGCNNYCSYCVVPYTRGREKSRTSSSILNEIKILAGQGYKEITLLGQNVNSYGLDYSEGLTFPKLLIKVEEIPGIERVRFVTSHPKDFSKELINAIRDCDKVCEQIHLPAQSGSNKILSLMNRGYKIEDYIEKINLLKSNIPGVALSTDIIVGFPGETEWDFQATINLIKKMEFDNVFLFKYSPRANTAAAGLPNPIDEKTKKSRFEVLLNLQKSITMKLNKNLEGKVEKILVEGKSKNNSYKLTGRTRTNKVTNFLEGNGLIGKIIPIKIVRSGLYSLDGQVIERP